MLPPWISNRRSRRAIDPDRPVSIELVGELLEAARWSPSSVNEQPWRYLVFDDRDAEARERARGWLEPGNVWAKRAPVLLLSVVNRLWVRDGQVNRHAWHDVGAANMAIALVGCEAGLVVHAMAGFDRSKARDEGRVPEGSSPVAMIALGWPGDPNLLPEHQRARETADRQRKPVSELAYWGEWGKALP